MFLITLTQHKIADIVLINWAYIMSSHCLYNILQERAQHLRDIYIAISLGSWSVGS